MVKENTMIRMPQIIRTDRIFLDNDNPRHHPYQDQADTIEYLCRKENVLPLARDIVRHGVNPLEIFALLRSPNSKTSYIAGEGNRRLCAIKLLNDPDLAPPDMRKDFEKLGKEWEGIPTVLGLIFEDRQVLDTVWLPRIHGSEQGGIGRKAWNAEQKTRQLGGEKNKKAQAVLDYAQQKGFLTAEQRERKLTTAQRFLGNVLIREALGVDVDVDGEIVRTRPEHDIDMLLKKFTGDLVSPKSPVNSRANKPDIDAYARKLSGTKGQTGERVDPTPVKQAKKTKAFRKVAPKKPAKRTKITYEQAIYEALVELGSHKLERIYYSLCDISLEEHTPLLTVGAWSFLESLTGFAGRGENDNFAGFFSNDRLSTYGYTSGKAKNPIREALKRISENGNTTKHHRVAANFDGEQLANDMDTLKECVLKCVAEALDNKS